MTYDHWKTTNPADDFLGPDPDNQDEEAFRCANCGALTDGDGISIDERCCFYCRAD